MTLMEELKTKTFASEAEEAAWWESNEDRLTDEFIKATAEGRIKRGSVRRLFAERGLTFTEPPPPAQRA